MSDSIIVVIIAGIFTLIGTIIGIILNKNFEASEELRIRKNNQTSLIFKLCAINSTIKAINGEVKDLKEIKSSEDVIKIDTILKRRFEINKEIQRLEELFEKSIIPDIEKPEPFAEFSGLIVRLKVLMEHIDTLNENAVIIDLKPILDKETNEIIATIEKINSRIIVILNPPNKNYEAQYKYSLSIVIGMVTGLLSGIFTSSAFESDNLIAIIGMSLFLIIALIIFLIKYLKPELFPQHYWFIFADFIGIGMGTGFVTGIGSIALYKGQIGIFVLVLLVVLAAITVTRKTYKNFKEVKVEEMKSLSS